MIRKDLSKRAPLMRLRRSNKLATRVLVAIGIFLLVGCTQPEHNNDGDGLETISIGTIKPELLLFSENVDSITIIPLETRKECLIGMVTRRF